MLIGADPGQLRQLASLMTTTAHRIDSTRSEISSQLRSAAWEGDDSATFTELWDGSLTAKLRSVCSALSSNATALQRQAHEQEQASEGAGQAGNTAPGRADIPSRQIRDDPQIGKDGYGKYLPITTEIPLDKDTIKASADSVKQGSIGDCWLVATAAALARDHPELLANNIKKNPDGTYSVTLYRKDWLGNPQPVEVIVKPEVVSNGSRDTNGNMTWLTVYEKAWAQFKGSHAAIDGGFADDAFFMMTGKNSITIDREPSLEYLKQVRDKGGTIVMDTAPKGGEGFWESLLSDRDGPVPDGTVPNHQYALKDVVKQSDGTYKVTIQNPWGQGGSYTTDDGKASEYCTSELILTEDEYRKHMQNVTIWMP